MGGKEGEGGEGVIDRSHLVVGSEAQVPPRRKERKRRGMCPDTREGLLNPPGDTHLETCPGAKDPRERSAL